MLRLTARPRVRGLSPLTRLPCARASRLPATSRGIYYAAVPLYHRLSDARAAAGVDATQAQDSFLASLPDVVEARRLWAMPETPGSSDRLKTASDLLHRSTLLASSIFAPTSYPALFLRDMCWRLLQHPLLDQGNGPPAVPADINDHEYVWMQRLRWQLERRDLDACVEIATDHLLPSEPDDLAVALQTGQGPIVRSAVDILPYLLPASSTSSSLEFRPATNVSAAVCATSDGPEVFEDITDMPLPDLPSSVFGPAAALQHVLCCNLGAIHHHVAVGVRNGDLDVSSAEESKRFFAGDVDANFDAAEQAYRRALAMQDAVYTPAESSSSPSASTSSDPDTGSVTASLDHAMTLYNLGELMYHRGDFKSASKLLPRAQAVFRSVAGLEHPFTAQTILLLGQVHQKMDNMIIAEGLLNTAKMLLLAAFGPSSPAIAGAARAMERLYRVQGRFSKASEYQAMLDELGERAVPPSRLCIYDLHTVLWLHPAKAVEQSQKP